MIQDIEHASMDFSIHAQEDICPLDQRTLQQARPAIAFSKYLIIFQLSFSIILCICAGFIDSGLVFMISLGELMVICFPTYFYLSWALRDVVLHKTEV